jgi:hypothetical protein
MWTILIVGLIGSNCENFMKTLRLMNSVIYTISLSCEMGAAFEGAAGNICT